MDRCTETAQQLLVENGYTCVLCSADAEYHSRDRGVKPLIDFIDSGVDFHGFFAADKTVGAGAAHAYVILGVAEVWAKVISESGKHVLENNGIRVFADVVVPYIINRAGDGVCPFETAVRDIDDSERALAVMKEKLKQMSQK